MFKFRFYLKIIFYDQENKATCFATMKLVYLTVWAFTWLFIAHSNTTFTHDSRDDDISGQFIPKIAL